MYMFYLLFFIRIGLFQFAKLYKKYLKFEMWNG